MGDRRSVPGPTLAVEPGEVALYRIPNHTPLCWNETWRTDSRTVIYGNGTAVAFTERAPAVAGFEFGDPVFSGTGVPDANSAQMRAEGMETAEVTFTNQVNPGLSPVGVAPGACSGCVGADG